jgi:hypothetical protein
MRGAKKKVEQLKWIGIDSTTKRRDEKKCRVSSNGCNAKRNAKTKDKAQQQTPIAGGAMRR